MAEYIRMREDREGAHDHLHVHTYLAGEVYHLRRADPPISQELLDGFVASGHAVEVDAAGNPLNIPADKRETKPTGPKATKAAEPAPEPEPSAPTLDAALTARLYPAEDAPATPETEPKAK